MTDGGGAFLPKVKVKVSFKKPPPNLIFLINKGKKRGNDKFQFKAPQLGGG